MFIVMDRRADFYTFKTIQCNVRVYLCTFISVGTSFAFYGSVPGETWPGESLIKKLPLEQRIDNWKKDNLSGVVVFGLIRGVS